MTTPSDTAETTTMTPPETPLAEIRRQRIAKLDKFAESGMDPYGARVDGLVSVAEARRLFDVAADDGDPVRVKIAGRLMSKRLMGKSSFCDIKDKTGRLQIYAQKNVLGEGLFDLFKIVDIGDILTVEGELFRTRTDEVTVRIGTFQLLSKSLRPLPEKWHGLTDVEQRLRQRYLDLATNDAVRDVFLARVKIVRAIRAFLDDQGFMEVETPMLQPIPGGAAARPFETYYGALDCPMYMRIAPELYLKRLLVAGFEKVYEINRNFRNEGLSRNHNPEFTMVELYEAYGDCRTMMDLVEGLITTVAQEVLGGLLIQFDEEKTIDLSRPWRRVPYAELVRERMGDDWYDLPVAAQVEKAAALGLQVDVKMSAVEITHEVYEKVIEDTLIQPTFVTRLPAELVPLAKRCEDDPTVVDVFELEINGQEISPGYSELNDPLEQRRRFEQQAVPEEAEAEGRIDEDFLTALEHGMPPAGGAGIGIDRLVMLLLAAPSIRDVILFPQLRPTRPQETDTHA